MEYLLSKYTFSGLILLPNPLRLLCLCANCVLTSAFDFVLYIPTILFSILSLSNEKF
jgi:hypothetical protein